MNVITDENKINEILTRGVEEVIVEESLKKKLLSGKKLTIKFGIDPTGSSIHIGHAVPLQKLRQFQELGHHVILLIGDYTAMIGDPTGRNETRPILTRSDVEKNMKNYIEQAGKILDMNNVEVRYNSEWFGKKDSSFFMQLTAMVTVARILDRDDFKKRLAEGSDISMQELMYPLMQGYDSVELKADVEIGGTDQKFNLLMGRRLQKKYGQEEQDVIAVPLLEGTDGEKKMSKTYGNFIAVLDTPEDIFGKTMSIPDSMIIKYFKLATDVPMEKIEEYEKMLKTGENPKNIKMKLAFALTEFYCGEESAKLGQAHFEKVIQSKDRPDEIPELKPTSYNIIEVLVESGLSTGKSDARRSIEQGGVKVNDEKIEAFDYDTKPEDVIQKGKRFFVKVK